VIPIIFKLLLQAPNNVKELALQHMIVVMGTPQGVGVVLRESFFQV